MAKRPEDRPVTPQEVASLLAPFSLLANLGQVLDDALDESAGKRISPPESSAALPFCSRQHAPEQPPVHRSPVWFAGWAVVVLAVFGGAALVATVALSNRYRKPQGAKSPRLAAAASSLRPPPATNLGQPNLPVASAPARSDRAAAEMLLARGGKVGLGGVPVIGWVEVSAGGELPSGGFDLVLADTLGKPISDADLAKFARLPHFTTLNIGSAPVTDAGLANLGELPKLAAVYASGTQIGDPGLRLLAERFPTINTLHAGKTRITDAGVRALLKFADLQSLRLENPAITDESPETLERLKKLRVVCLQGTQISEAGITRLRQVLPHATFETSYGNFEPRTLGPPLADRTVAQWAHSLGGEVGLARTTKGYASIKPDGELPDGYYELNLLALIKKPLQDSDFARLDGLESFTTLIAHDNAISDAGLAQMDRLPLLEKVYLSRTNITNAGLRSLTSRYPAVRILHAGDTNIADEGVPALRAWPGMTELSLRNCEVTDASLGTLLALSDLRLLHIHGTGVSREGVERLRAGLPKCRLETSFGDFAPIEK